MCFSIRLNLYLLLIDKYPLKYNLLLKQFKTYRLEFRFCTIRVNQIVVGSSPTIIYWPQKKALNLVHIL